MSQYLISGELALSPAVATFLFVVAVLAGTRYRSVWKAEGSAAQLWGCGLLAGGCLLILGFVPIAG
nr:hypothetical protein [Thalassobius sp. Cn5-15]